MFYYFCSSVNESGTIIRLNPEHLEGTFVFGELSKILCCDGFLYSVFIKWINQGNASALKACTRESSAPE